MYYLLVLNYISILFYNLIKSILQINETIKYIKNENDLKNKANIYMFIKNKIDFKTI